VSRLEEKGALAEYRIIDLTDEKALLCARFLADMGAEVTRIESPGKTPPLRWENLGKQFVTLDIKREEGRELFKRLVSTADALIESHPPGYLDNLGLGYSKLAQSNPRLILASLTPFGGDGPYRDFKADDLVAGAMGGQLYVNGEAEKPPLKLFGNQSYYLASLFAAIGILLALNHRHTTGKGQHIDISLQECVAASLDHVLVRYFYEDTVAKRRGSLHWNNAFRVFLAKDGHVLLTMFYQWPTLVEWLESEGMAEDLADKKWRSRDYRLEHLDHIIEVLERWTKSHTKAELVEKGQLMRFPWAEVASISDLLASPQLKARNFWQEIEYQGKKYKIPGSVL
jgi:crotonobetainyl-CoA:carnitine CoA-transferase CaiB-like acyl-CoA transferase